ncbi:hypothetical protein STAFG_3131 [Streptomyces afghaniensis 772]|uniref:Uncharacterized protein n=1 Tax=Streptomyces afghaniensis 772 TaxID=1283301 RepID=S4MT53_9ACTN|nr:MULTISPECIES: hypothetical protein [Streptomyces]EPJ39821.1 hypothetical protein STAFG_3131 [Streptomyces afghaniensis 772]UOB15055.1 hypothetical protein MQE23_40965 [Streptomyces sp. HP-A2021]
MTAMEGLPADVDLRAFHNDVEGHLLAAAAHEEARAAAARFAARLDRLPEAQREEVERLFAAEHLALARASWERTARRGQELRGEYEEVYRMLRARLLAGLLLGCAVLVAVTLVVLVSL